MALTGVVCADTLPYDNTKDTITAFSSNDGNHNHSQESVMYMLYPHQG